MKHFILFALMVVSLAGYSQSWRGNNVDARISMYGPVRDPAFWTPYRNGAFLVSPIDGEFYYWWNGQWRKPGTSIIATNGLNLSGTNLMLGRDSADDGGAFTASRQINTGNKTLLIRGFLETENLTIREYKEHNYSSPINSSLVFETVELPESEFDNPYRRPLFKLNATAGKYPFPFTEHVMEYETSTTSSGHLFTAKNSSNVSEPYFGIFNNYQYGDPSLIAWKPMMFFDNAYINLGAVEYHKAGTTTQRPATTVGFSPFIIRPNSDSDRVDFFDGTAWRQFAFTSDFASAIPVLTVSQGLSRVGNNIMLGVDSGNATNAFTSSRQINLGGYNLLFNGNIGTVDRLTINASTSESGAGVNIKVPFYGEPTSKLNNTMNIKRGNGYTYPEYYMNFDVEFPSSGYNFTGSGGATKFFMAHSNYRSGGWPGIAFYGDVWIEEKSLVINREVGGFASFMIDLPGTTAQRRSSPGAGLFRYNTTLNRIDLHNGTSWQNLAYTSDLTSFVTSSALTDSLNKVDTLETFVRNDSVFLRTKIFGGGIVEDFQYKLSSSLADNSINRTKLKNERLQWDIYEEFISSGMGGNFVVYSANGGSGGPAGNTLSNVHVFGEAQISPNTSSANGRGSVSTNETFTFNSKTYRAEFDSLFNNALNNGTDSVALLLGFFDNINSDNFPANGVYLQYDAGSANWQIRSRSAGVESIQTTTTAVTTGKVRVTIVANATQAMFFVNGTQIGTTVTANIPSNVSNRVGLGAKIMKRGGTGWRYAGFDKLKFRIDE